MPRKDGTGPMGTRAITGRGIGLCAGANVARYGSGFGRGCAVSDKFYKTQKEFLLEQKDILQNHLEVIDKQLENL